MDELKAAIISAIGAGLTVWWKIMGSEKAIKAEVKLRVDETVLKFLDPRTSEHVQAQMAWQKKIEEEVAGLKSQLQQMALHQANRGRASIEFEDEIRDHLAAIKTMATGGLPRADVVVVPDHTKKR